VTVTEIGRLIDDIYRAGEDPTLWPVAMAALAAALESPSMVLHMQITGATQIGHVRTAVGVEPSAQEGYDEYYGARNVWTIKGRHRLCEGAVLTGQMVCSDAELEASEYYNDYLRHLGFYHSLAVIPRLGPDGALVLTSLRPRSAGPFSAEAIELMRVLSPHLVRASWLHGHLCDLDRQRSAMADALDHMAVGVVLVDGQERVVFANSAAVRIATRRDGLCLDSKGLSGFGSENATALRQALDAAVGRRIGSTLQLGRASSKPLRVLVAPLTQAGETFGVPHAIAGVFITDPDARLAVDEQRLREFFALTPAEAKLACAIGEGLDLARCAAKLGIGLGTVRTRLKTVFQKTGTHRQAELVQLIACLTLLPLA
jgi:DNA-binding CsgD family transcriptional regulator/PAS domain-containing protein